MKKVFLTLQLIFSTFFCFSQQSFTLQNQLKSVTITPDAIETRREGLDFDTLNKNVVIGKGNLLHPNTRGNNVAIGTNVLAKNGLGSTSATQAANNIAVGVNIMTENKLGFNNIVMGTNSLTKPSNENANNLISIGNTNMINSGSLRNSIALGNNIYEGNVLGISCGVPPNKNNIGIGDSTMQRLWCSQDNVGIGVRSLQNIMIGGKNVAIGTSSMGGVLAPSSSSTGSPREIIGNVAVGYNSLFNNINGDYNVALGYKAGYRETGRNKLYIENSDSLYTLIGGDFERNKVGINRTMADIAATSFTFQVGGDASKNVAGNWSSHSDKRLKKNIEPLDSQKILSQLLRLKGVTYSWNDTVTNTKRPEGLQYGFIAQNIEEVFPDKIKKDSKGLLMTAYGDYDPMIVEALRALSQKIDKLELQNIELKNTLKTVLTSIAQNENTNAQEIDKSILNN